MGHISSERLSRKTQVRRSMRDSKSNANFYNPRKLDLLGAAQGDGAGGDWADLFSPEFMCTTSPTGPPAGLRSLFQALPILGKDGTLAKIQPNSPGAGQSTQKTGTFGFRRPI